MVRFVRLVALSIVGIVSVFRGAEEAIAIWVRRATRERDLSGVAWA